MRTLKELNGKTFYCKRIAEGMNCIEDIDSLRDTINANMAKHGITDALQEDEKQWSCGNQFMMKPKCHKETDGEIYFRPGGDYVFRYARQSSYGSKIKAENITETGIKMPTMQGGAFNYILGEEKQ